MANPTINLEKTLDMVVETTSAASTTEFIVFPIDEDVTFTLHSGYHRCTALKSTLVAALKKNRKIFASRLKKPLKCSYCNSN